MTRGLVTTAAVFVLCAATAACNASSVEKPPAAASTSGSTNASSQPSTSTSSTTTSTDAQSDGSSVSDTVTTTTTAVDPYATPSQTGAVITTGTALTLASFFEPDSSWSDGRFDVPSLGQVVGVGGTVATCGRDYAKPLELRLNGNFKTFELKATLGGETDDSSQRLEVSLFNNLDYIDSKTVEYGSSVTFPKRDVSGVSALKIYLDLDPKICQQHNGSVFAVLYDMHVA